MVTPQLTELWIVGLWRDESAWDLVGVFDKEQDAIDVCRTSNHFVGPAVLGADRGDGPVNWERQYYRGANAESRRLSRHQTQDTGGQSMVTHPPSSTTLCNAGDVEGHTIPASRDKTAGALCQ